MAHYISSEKTYFELQNTNDKIGLFFRITYNEIDDACKVALHSRILD